MGNEKTKLFRDVRNFDGVGCAGVAFSGAYEPCVKAAGKSGISRSLHNSASVGKDGERVLAACKAQQKLIEADLAMRFEARFERD